MMMMMMMMIIIITVKSRPTSTTTGIIIIVTFISVNNNNTNNFLWCCQSLNCVVMNILKGQICCMLFVFLLHVASTNWHNTETSRWLVGNVCRLWCGLTDTACSAIPHPVWSAVLIFTTFMCIFCALLSQNYSVLDHGLHQRTLHYVFVCVCRFVIIRCDCVHYVCPPVTLSLCNIINI
jgi:hypothetical protein